MQLHKIKQYNIIDLIHILFYKVMYKFRLSIRKVIVKTTHPTYSIISGNKVDERYQRLSSSLYPYYGFVCKSNVVKEKGDAILRGNTTIFGHNYHFNPETDWLKDHETGKFWPEVYWDKAKFIEKGLADVKYVLEVNKLNDVVILAHTYYITKDEKYLYGVEKYLVGWVKCVPMEKSVANKIVMDFGFRVINLVHISLLCCENAYFRNNIHPIIMGVVKHHVSHLWRFLSSRWFKSGNDNNHNIGEIIGLYIGQIWMHEFGSFGGHFVQKQVNQEIQYLREVTEKLISTRGTYLEQSASYTRLVHDFYLMFEIFRHSLDYNRNFGWFDKSVYFDKLSQYLLHISYHGILPNFGDNDYARVVIPFEDEHDVVTHVRKHSEKSDVISNYDEDGQWIYRSQDENDVFLFSRVGRFSKFVEGAFIHAHNDLLSIILSLKGKQVFIDKGTLYYNSGADIRKEYTATGAHNTAQIGKNEMADFLPVGFSHYPKSSLLTSEKKRSSCRFEGEATYKNITHHREIKYDGQLISIIDKISLFNNSKEMGYVRYLCEENVSISKDGDSYKLLDNEGKFLCKVSFLGVLSSSVQDTTYAPHYGLNRSTSMIEAVFDIDKFHEVKTIIQVV